MAPDAHPIDRFFLMSPTVDQNGSRRTLRLAALLLALVLVVVLAAVVQFGLPVLGLLGLALTAAFFAVMLVFMAGN